MISRVQALLRAGCWGSLLLIGCASGCRSETPERGPARGAPEHQPFPQQPPVPERPPGTLVRPVQPREFCITLGFSEAAARQQPWINRQPEVRATIADSAGAHAALAFRYLGPTPSEKPLRSGVVRRQIGLKLFSEDTCNLLYVMWRFDSSSVVVSVKRNPGEHRHVQCTNHGYRNVRPTWSVPVAAPSPESVHELAARVQSSRLTVNIDGQPVLQADLSGESLPQEGQSGLRSDNVAFELVRFVADMRPLPEAELPARCRRLQAEGSD